MEPPRMWGIRQAAEGRELRGRFIPTPVGNTLPAKPCTRATAVHPHACGEYPVKTRPVF